MQIPGIWTAGDTITWVDSVAYDNQGLAITPDFWTLNYSIRGPSSLDLASTAAQGGWTVVATGIETAGLTPGDYWWQATAIRISDGTRFTCGAGQLRVTVNLAALAATTPTPTPPPVTTDITGTAAATISGQIAVAVTSAGLVPADSGTVALAGSVTGIATNAAVVGGSVTVQADGLVTFNGWTWTPGQPVFIGPLGVLTQTPPDVGFLQIVGTADAPTAIVVSLEPPIIL